MNVFSWGQAAVAVAGLAMLPAGWWVRAVVHDRARRRAAARERLLTRVVETESLEPQAVLAAVVAGIEACGFDRVSIRRIESDQDAAVRPETAMLEIALGPAHAPLAVLRAGRARGRPTRSQRHAAAVLADQAGAALQRAVRYEEGQRVLRDLRALDDRAQDFVSTVSHELRTPLAVIQGLGQTLARRWDELDATRRADLSARIDANAQRLSDMVRSLLTTSALEEGHLDIRLQEVALRPLVSGLLHRLADVTAVHPVQVDVDAEVRVRADPGLLAHVFENLLTNVARHTPQATHVHVTAVRRGDEVRLSVADDGPGISAEDLPHVLERFYRGGDLNERRRGGLGLGLALAAQIVEAHGSRLEVASEPDLGTTFRWSLPAVSAPVVSGAANDVRSGR